MATKLTKAVVREVDGWCRKGMFGMGGRSGVRPLVVELLPAGILSLRQKGLRSSYEIDLETVFNLAVKASVQASKLERAKARAVKRL